MLVFSNEPIFSHRSFHFWWGHTAKDVPAVLGSPRPRFLSVFSMGFSIIILLPFSPSLHSFSHRRDSFCGSCRGIASHNPNLYIQLNFLPTLMRWHHISAFINFFFILLAFTSKYSISSVFPRMFLSSCSLRQYRPLSRSPSENHTNDHVLCIIRVSLQSALPHVCRLSPWPSPKTNRTPVWSVSLGYPPPRTARILEKQMMQESGHHRSRRTWLRVSTFFAY